jgi:hypothetical protein
MTTCVCGMTGVGAFYRTKPLHQLEAPHAAVKRQSTIKVSYLQMDVTDANLGMPTPLDWRGSCHKNCIVFATKLQPIKLGTSLVRVVRSQKVSGVLSCFLQSTFWV